uniref:Uncharacterized protein n=1 Tax=Molossus molossus TaxID=27622 RepID=A0A7J8E2Z1_MOLMO|nr:hypothetical protein HJG59_009033 [Molossus molossus]
MSRLPGLRWRSCRHHHSQKQGWSQSREGASSPQLGYSLCLPGWVLSNLLTHCKSQIYPSKTKIVTFEGFPTDLQKGLTRRLNEEFQTLVPAASLWYPTPRRSHSSRRSLSKSICSSQASMLFQQRSSCTHRSLSVFLRGMVPLLTA